MVPTLHRAACKCLREVRHSARLRAALRLHHGLIIIHGFQLLRACAAPTQAQLVTSAVRGGGSRGGGSADEEDSAGKVQQRGPARRDRPGREDERLGMPDATQLLQLVGEVLVAPHGLVVCLALPIFLGFSPEACACVWPVKRAQSSVPTPDRSQEISARWRSASAGQWQPGVSYTTTSYLEAHSSKAAPASALHTCSLLSYRLAPSNLESARRKILNAVSVPCHSVRSASQTRSAMRPPACCRTSPTRSSAHSCLWAVTATTRGHAGAHTSSFCWRVLYLPAPRRAYSFFFNPAPFPRCRCKPSERRCLLGLCGLLTGPLCRREESGRRGTGPAPRQRRFARRRRRQRACWRRLRCAATSWALCCGESPDRLRRPYPG